MLHLLQCDGTYGGLLQFSSFFGREKKQNKTMNVKLTNVVMLRAVVLSAAPEIGSQPLQQKHFSARYEALQSWTLSNLKLPLDIERAHQIKHRI